MANANHTEQDDGARIVARVRGLPVSRNDITHAFNRVANPTNWKLPIDVVVELAGDIGYERELIDEAISFFAGCRATFEKVSPADHRDQSRHGCAAHLRPIAYRVTAVGYYAAVGA